jgi:hypothetical protein
MTVLGRLIRWPSRSAGGSGGHGYRPGVFGRGWSAVLGVGGTGSGRGTAPRCSDDEPGGAGEDQRQSGLDRTGGRQVELDLGLHLDDACGDLEQTG